MSRNAEESPAGIFFIWSIIFCFATWSIWGHYRTVTGPTTQATVVGKKAEWHKNSYDYYLNIHFVYEGLKVARSRLEIEKSRYYEFEVGDTFPIKYAKNSPEDTAFVGEPFYTTFGGVGYGIMVLILVVSFRAMRQEGKRPRKSTPRPKPRKPAHYSADLTLAWAALGAAVFSGGIVSCRQGANAASTPPQTHEYQHATLLLTEYSATTNYTSALVQMPAPATPGPVRLSLSPEQYALLCARMSRPHSDSLQVLIAYLPAAPNQVVLADTKLQPVTANTDSPLGISYNLLGVLLIVVGVVLIVTNLVKYARRVDT